MKTILLNPCESIFKALSVHRCLVQQSRGSRLIRTIETKWRARARFLYMRVHYRFDSVVREDVAICDLGSQGVSHHHDSILGILIMPGIFLQNARIQTIT